jgi:hypothetical protein
LLQKYLEIRDTWLRFSSLKSQAKMDYLETQKKLLLVSKIVDKIRSLAQVEEENLNLKTVEEPNINYGTALFADLRLFITLMKYLNTP